MDKVSKEIFPLSVFDKIYFHLHQNLMEKLNAEYHQTFSYGKGYFNYEILNLRDQYYELSGYGYSIIPAANYRDLTSIHLRKLEVYCHVFPIYKEYIAYTAKKVSEPYLPIAYQYTNDVDYTEQN